MQMVPMISRLSCTAMRPVMSNTPTHDARLSRFPADIHEHTTHFLGPVPDERSNFYFCICLSVSYVSLCHQMEEVHSGCVRMLHGQQTGHGRGCPISIHSFFCEIFCLGKSRSMDFRRWNPMMEYLGFSVFSEESESSYHACMGIWKRRKHVRLVG